jgi:hypothetical protein
VFVDNLLQIRIGEIVDDLGCGADALLRRAMLGVRRPSSLGRGGGMPVVAGRSIFGEIKRLQGPDHSARM